MKMHSQTDRRTYRFN